MFFSKRFAPLFWAQSLGAFNDNMFKNAIVILIMFSSLENSGSLVAIAGALFVAPYIFLSATAGKWADSVERSGLVFKTKILEVILMIIGVFGFYYNNHYLLLAILFGLGVQATLFSPMKYSLLPDHLHRDELIKGNGYLEAGTFIGILGGTILGGILVASGTDPVNIGLLSVAIAILGVVFAYFVPTAPIANIDGTKNFHLWRNTKEAIKTARIPEVWSAIFGIGWFWAVGAILLTSFPLIVKENLNGSASLVTLLLTLFAVGTAVGSLSAHLLTKEKVTGKYSAISMLGIGAFCLLFSYSAQSVTHVVTFSDINSILQLNVITMLISLMALSMMGGILSVPLYSILQIKSPKKNLSEIIAVNNIINALMMVIASLLFAYFHYKGNTTTDILKIVSIGALGVSIWLFFKWPPKNIIQNVILKYFKVFHKLEIKGLENIPQTPVLFIPNHLSFLDGILLASALPKDKEVSFAIYTHIANQKLIKLLLSIVDYVKVDGSNPMAIKTMARSLKEKSLVIFPEGRISLTSSLMKIYEGAGIVAFNAKAPVLPVLISGLESHPLSRSSHFFQRKWFQKVSLEFLKPTDIVVPPSTHKRTAIKNQLLDIMRSAQFYRHDYDNIYHGMIESSKKFGLKSIVYKEADNTSIDFKTLIKGSYLIGKKLAAYNISKNNNNDRIEEALGILLPNTKALAVTFYGCLGMGIVPALLNFSSSVQSIKSCIKASGIKHVVTSTAFIEKGKLQHIIKALNEENINIIYLEDVKKSISLFDKLSTFFYSYKRMPGSKVSIAMPAVILFTSGSEGTPKGVVLTHKNILSNAYQMKSVFDFNPRDLVLNAMPCFHSFGMMGGLILPILSGAPVLFYPSPLHYKIIPEVSYLNSCTILFGTDSFLRGWAKYGDPQDFKNIRMCFSGAEKVQNATHSLYLEKYGIRIFEGYGATECSPVISVNNFDQNKMGTCGVFLPHIEYVIESVEGIETGGVLKVNGPNLFLGYLRESNPQIIEKQTGFYDTGDIVSVEDGFVKIEGRMKRFSKIGGEMVSLSASENIINKIKPLDQNSIISIPDDKKGEKLVLFTTSDITQKEILEYIKSHELSILNAPKEIIDIKTIGMKNIPVLGSGKVDYVTLASIYREKYDRS